MRKGQVLTVSCPRCKAEIGHACIACETKMLRRQLQITQEALVQIQAKNIASEAAGIAFRALRRIGAMH